MTEPILTEIRLAAGADAWVAAGFAVADGRCGLGDVELAFVDGQAGIVDWALTDVRSAGIDGLSTRPAATGGGVAGPAVEHPNTVMALDHVVVFTPQVERTTAALEAEGIRLRRTREGGTNVGGRRQGFFRVGRPILEVLEAPELGAEQPARFWGLSFAVRDIDAACELLGDRLGAIRDAVQPGRRIATFRSEAGLGLPVALITAR